MCCTEKDNRAACIDGEHGTGFAGLRLDILVQVEHGTQQVLQPSHNSTEYFRCCSSVAQEKAYQYPSLRLSLSMAIRSAVASWICTGRIVLSAAIHRRRHDEQTIGPSILPRDSRPDYKTG